MRVLVFLAILFSALISGCGGGGGGGIASDGVNASQQQIEGYENMPAGLQVIGDHGYLQIDGSSVNLGLRDKGTATFTTSVDLLVTDVDTPLICLRSDVTVMVQGATRSGTTITYRLAVGSGVSATVGWYVFDKMRLTATSGAGLQVYNDAGVLTFDSTNYPIRIVGIADNNPGPASIVVSAGLYAACLSMSRINRVVSGGLIDPIFGEGVRTSATGADVGSLVFKTLPAGIGPIGPWQPNAGKLFLVDVTNL